MNMLTRLSSAEPAEDALSATGAKANRWRIAVVAVVIAAALAAAIWWGKGETAPPAMPTPTVTVAQPIERVITQWDDYVGRFEASRSVEVRPRVSGQIVGVHFRDGALVQKGQLLFTIDPRPYEAALAEARAGVAAAQSELALAQTNLGRARTLLQEGAVAQSSVDQLSARFQAARAALEAARARVRQRSLDLEFSRIRAPIGGRISDRRIDAGNLVSAGDSGGTLLTTINALDPIHFTFDVPESLYLKTLRQRSANSPAPVAEIRLQDEAGYSRRGVLDFTDNGVGQTSGTIRARAVVRNPDLFLAPGLFGNMRLTDGAKTRAMLVPDAAIRVDQARKIVMVVGTDGTVGVKPVETGPLVAGLRVVRSGLARTDRVIVQGVQFAMPGSKVNVRSTRIMPVEASSANAPAATVPAASQATLASN